LAGETSISFAFGVVARTYPFVDYCRRHDE